MSKDPRAGNFATKCTSTDPSNASNGKCGLFRTGPEKVVTKVRRKIVASGSPCTGRSGVSVKLAELKCEIT